MTERVEPADMEMGESRLGEIERRADAATRGPWDTIQPTDCGLLVDVFAGDVTHTVAHVNGYDGAHHLSMRNDAAFIAAARSDIPDLVSEVRRLKAALLTAEARVAEFEQECDEEVIDREQALYELTDAQRALVLLANQLEQHSVPFVPEAEAAIAKARAEIQHLEDAIERGMRVATEVFNAARAQAATEES